MKEKLTKQIIWIAFLIGSLIIFNVVPFISQDIEYASYNTLEFLSLVIINPLYLGVCGFIYGVKFGFSWFLPMALSICFIPTVILFFEVSFMFYIIVYVIFVISSELCGISFNRIKQFQN